VREPPKRRHFAAITVATETRPFHPCAASIYQQQKTQDSKGFRSKSFGPVWAASGHRPTPARGRPVAAAPLTPGLFCRWKIEASQGRNGHIPAGTMIAAKCRRLGGSLSSGLEPLVSNHSLGVTSECGLLAF